ncbi:MAG: shikimate dehydrogenase, partial [Gemmatimonadales bacterium]
MIEQRRFGLIGDPVANSMSPIMHRAGFTAIGIEGSYGLFPVPAELPDLVEAEMRRLASTGGGNVTVPHKVAAARALDQSTETVTALGACNC